MRWGILQRKAQEARAGRAFNLFRDHGIEPILIKGLAVGLFYPGSKVREATDIDLAVASADHKAADALARSSAANGLAIDLHRELRHLDTVDWDDLFDNSRLVPVEGGTIRVLRPEDHLRVVAIHWLTDGGSSRERLWDIYYMIAHRPADFDWNRFLSIVSPRRRRWLVCAVGLAHRYLDLDLTDTPIEDEAKRLPKWLVRTVQREWAKEIPDRPLETTLNDPRMLALQAGRRLRPNPIWATIQMEGDFDARTRVFYQIGNAIKRIMPSYRRIRDTIKPPVQ
jgi:hypothetical protein